MFIFITPATPCGQLCMRVPSFYELLKILLALLVNTFAYTTGTTFKHQRATWPELYPKSIVFLRIVACHMSVLSLAQCLRLQSRMLRRYQKRSKKLISTLNFETSLLSNVTAKKSIRNMYFMPWFQSLSRLEHDMYIRLFDLCIKYAQCLCAGGLIRLARKECFLLPFLPGMLSL